MESKEQEKGIKSQEVVTDPITSPDRLVYLQQIQINTDAKTRFQVKLRVNDIEVKNWVDWATAEWTQYLNQEITNTSNIELQTAWDHKIKRLFSPRPPSVVRFKGDQAVDLLWESEDSISRSLTFDGHTMAIVFKFAPSTTSRGIRDAVQDVQTALENYRSVMSDTTQRRLNTVAMYGVAISEANPFAKAAVSVVKATFDLLQQQKKYDDMLSDLADGMGRILPVIEAALNFVSAKDEKGLIKSAISKLCELIETATPFILGYVKRSPARRAANSIVSPKDHLMIEGLRNDFNKLKESFDRGVGLETLTGITSIEAELLLRRLRPVESSGYTDSYKCLEGTREQVLDNLVRWAKTTSSILNQKRTTDNVDVVAGNILWLYGMPGLGKTSVANSVCARLHEQKMLGGSFFCRRDDPILSQPKYVLPTFIYRLAGVWGPFGRSVASVLRDDQQITPESANLLLSKTLLEPLETLEKHPSHSLVLVIDALDECGDSQSRRSLLQGIKEALSRVPWLKVIVTSRPEPDIDLFFKKLDAASYSSLDLSADEHSMKDIRFFAEQRLASIAERRHLTNWPSESQISRLVDLSRGLYIFVETLWRFMDKQRNPEKSLNQVLDKSPEEGLCDLYRLYTLAITTIVGDDSEDFRTIIGAIICVSKYRPLRDGTLAALSGLEASTVRAWVDDLNSLLYSDGPDGKIRVRHLSIIDYLKHPSCPEALRPNFEESNAAIGKTCLTVMIRELKFNICDLETASKFNAEFSDLNTRIEQKISDALQYSCVHWAGHLCSIDDWSGTDIRTMLSEVLRRERSLHWMEVLSLTRNVSEGAPSLRKLISRIKESQDPLEQHFSDILRFIVTFHALISTSAAQIYISALPFSPLNSILWNSVKDLFPNLLEIRRGRSDSWPAPSYIWQGHGGLVSSIACSSDGQHIASGSYDGTVRIWDAETGTTVGEPLKGHADIIHCVTYSPDGRYLASGSNDNTVHIWDSQTRTLAIEPLMKHGDWVLAVSFSPNGRYLVSGSKDKLVRIWDVETGVKLGDPLVGHTDWVTGVAYSFDGTRIVSVSSDQTIRVWDARTGAPTRPTILTSAAIQSIAYSPNSHKVACGSKDKTIGIWDVEAGVMVGQPLVGHRDWVVSVAFSPNGRLITSGSPDGRIYIWDSDSGTSLADPMIGDVSEVASVVFSMDGQRIFSGFADRSIRVWDVSTGKPASEQMALQGHTAEVTRVAYSPDGRHVASCAHDKTVRIWDPETGRQLDELVKGRITTGVVNSLAYSPDGRYIAVGCSDKSLRIWDLESSAPVGSPIMDHSFGVDAVAYSPDGKYLLSGSRDCTIHIWDVKAQKPAMPPLTGHFGQVNSIAFSPDGCRLASGSRDGTVHIWDATRWAAIGEPLTTHTNSVTGVSFSPNGSRIVSVSWDHKVCVWDVDTRKEVFGPLKHYDWVKSVAYSPDGKLVVSAGRDNVIRVWDAQNGVPFCKPLIGHTREINSICYSPDGRYIVSGSGDKTIRIWDMELALQSGNSSETSSVNENGASSNDILENDEQPPPYSDVTVIKEDFEPKPDSDGWVRYNSCLLFWVPEDCRNGLTSPAIMTMPTNGPQRVIRMNFSRFKYGSAWTSVYKP